MALLAEPTTDLVAKMGKAYQDEILKHNATRQTLYAEAGRRENAEAEYWNLQVFTSRLQATHDRTFHFRQQAEQANRAFAAENQNLKAEIEGMITHVQALTNQCRFREVRCIRKVMIVPTSAETFQNVNNRLRLNLDKGKDRQISVLKRKLDRAFGQASDGGSSTEENGGKASRMSKAER